MSETYIQGLIIGFITGFISGFVVNLFFLRFTPTWEPFKDRLSETFRKFRKKKTRIKIGTVEITEAMEATLKPVKIGNVLLPLRIFVGGDGKTKYKFPESIICIWSREKLTLPEDVLECYSRFLEKRRQEAAKRKAVFENRDHVRLDDYEILISGVEDSPTRLKLFVSTVDY